MTLLSIAVPRIHFHPKTAQSCLSTGKVFEGLIGLAGATLKNLNERQDQRRG